MRALILSGGSTRGPLQVGALRALLEEGFKFDMIVGVSIGSLNGIMFAYKPTMESIERLEEIWLSVKKEDIFPEGRVKAIFRLITNKKSLFSNDAFYKFILKTVPVMTFSELSLQMFIPAVNIKNRRVYVFGDDPYDSVPDALMASSALPPYFPPWKYKGMYLIDGGFYSNLPYDIAIGKGAKEIVALHIVGGRSFDDEIYNMYGVLAQAIGVLLEARIREQENIVRKKKVKVIYIPLDPPFDVSIFDFSKTKELINSGYVQAKKKLSEITTHETLTQKFKNILKRIPYLNKIAASK